MYKRQGHGVIHWQKRCDQRLTGVEPWSSLGAVAQYSGIQHSLQLYWIATNNENQLVCVYVCVCVCVYTCRMCVYERSVNYILKSTTCTHPFYTYMMFSCQEMELMALVTLTDKTWQMWPYLASKETLRRPGSHFFLHLQALNCYVRSPGYSLEGQAWGGCL